MNNTVATLHIGKTTEWI